MHEASWHKAGGRKSCAKLRSTAAPPRLCSCQSCHLGTWVQQMLPSGNVGPALLYLLIYFFFPSMVFNIYIWIKISLTFKIPCNKQYTFVAHLWVVNLCVYNTKGGYILFSKQATFPQSCLLKTQTFLLRVYLFFIKFYALVYE